jgi:hypothetical protein
MARAGREARSQPILDSPLTPQAQAPLVSDLPALLEPGFAGTYRGDPAPLSLVWSGSWASRSEAALVGRAIIV